MKKRFIRTAILGCLMGLCVVLARWIIECVFRINSFSGGQSKDLIIGISVFILLSLVSEYIKIRKEDKS